MAKDNTVLYIGIAVVAFMFLNSKKAQPLQQTVAPGEPMSTPEQQQLAQDIATGNVVLDIEKVPMVADNRDYDLIAECNMYRDSGISRFVYGSKCDNIV